VFSPSSSWPLLLSHSSYFWPSGMVAPLSNLACCSNCSLVTPLAPSRLASLRSISLRMAPLRSAPLRPVVPRNLYARQVPSNANRLYFAVGDSQEVAFLVEQVPKTVGVD
jgi:hypothetical protein